MRVLQGNSPISGVSEGEICSPEATLLLKRHRDSFVYCSVVLGRFLRGFTAGNGGRGVV